MLLGDPRQSDQRTQSFHFPIVVHQSLDPAAQSSAQAPSSLSLHALRSSSARQAQIRTRRRVRLRAVEVIICMITRDFSVISMTSQASLSLSLPLTKVTDAQYRKRFRASYNFDLPFVFGIAENTRSWKSNALIHCATEVAAFIRMALVCNTLEYHYISCPAV